MLAVARVPSCPFGGKGFVGFLGFLQARGHVRTFGTWNRWKVEICTFSGDGKGTVVLSDDHEQIICRVVSSRGGLLKAPERGAMNQGVKESINASVYLEIKDKDGIVFSLEGHPGGFEQR
jgi:hypothetical protein